MNEEQEQINSKIKKYSIALGSCALIFAIFAIALNSNNVGKTNDNELPVVTENRNVGVEATNIPDERRGATMIVPATEITTKAETTTCVSLAAAEETAAVSSAPDSYLLPLGTAMGDDYSMGIPVYNSVLSDWRTHDGVDFNGDYGDCVKAAANGAVKEIKSDAVMGDTIVIDHGGNVVAYYCGVTAVDTLKRGMMVSRGDKIGELSEIPCESDSEFPHLHLEIRVNGELVDPADVLGLYENE